MSSITPSEKMLTRLKIYLLCTFMERYWRLTVMEVRLSKASSFQNIDFIFQAERQADASIM